MKTIVFFLLLLGICLSCQTQHFPVGAKQSKFIGNSEFSVRTKPILNREYLLFLCWYIEVYGDSYPEKVLQILPEGSIDENVILNVQFKKLPASSKGILKDYILNPKYLNYPLTGLNTSQVLEVQKWMSDRYNENQLLELGILNWNPAQKDEDCFVTESYLVGQYQGNVRNNKLIEWKNEIFLPAFRLPFINEMDFIAEKLPVTERIQPYPFNKKDFLWRWNEYYLSKDKQGNIMLFAAYNPIQLKTIDKTLQPSITAAAKLEKESNSFLEKSYVPGVEGVLAITDFSKYPFPEKGKFGNMDFVIIGSNKAGKAIALQGELIDHLEEKKSDFEYYWVCYTKVY